MRKIYDISLTITPDLPVWPGDPPVKMRRVAKMEAGDLYNVTRLELSAHTGTHVDAPYHFIADGKPVDELSLDVLVGPVQVVEMPPECKVIGARELKNSALAAGVERVLFKTSNSQIWIEKRAGFQEEFVAISADGAEYLVRRGVRLVGIDYLSVAPFTESAPTHRILLAAGIVALEGVDLTDVPTGMYTLCCLPLKLGKADGAPARTILIQE